MRAWEELKNDRQAVICEDFNTEWFIDMGVMITRFKKDGSFLIQNTMTNNEYFDEISPSQYDKFKMYGWEIGCLNLNIDVNNETIERYANKLRHDINEDVRIILEDRLEKVINKNQYYIDKLEKLM